MCHCEETKGFKTPCFSYCKECNKVVNYATRFNYTTGKKRYKNFGLCSSCSKIGNRNPFFNKKHSDETINKIIETSNNSEKRKKYYEKIKSEEHRKFLSEWMKKNSPMKGTSFYEIWVEKYGVELADKMKKETIQKMSRKGEKNYWFGKTPPYGSGNGWSGWYKGWYFRSLLELSYMINIIEKYGLKWENGELNDYKIQYSHNENIKNYFPDFIIENKYMVECKPKKLWNTELVKNKKIAAEDFCKKNNLIYKLRDIPKISDSEIFSLCESGDLIWIDRYEEKFEKRLHKSPTIMGGGKLKKK
jgi:hypothetical protein